MLAVVDDDDRGSISKPLADPEQPVVAPLVDVEGERERRGHRRRLGHRRQIDEPDLLDLCGEVCCGLDRQAGLAHARRTDDRDQTPVAEVAIESVAVRPPADEGRQGQRQTRLRRPRNGLAPGRRLRQVEVGVLTDDGQLESAQRCAGLDPELLDQPIAQLPVRTERVGLTSAAVEGDHEVCPQLLTERIQAHRSLELADHGCMSAAGQLRGHTGFERGEPHLLQPDRLRSRKRCADLREGSAPPQGQRLLIRGDGFARRPARSCGSPLSDQFLEAHMVDVDSGAQAVAAPDRLDHRGRRSERGDVPARRRPAARCQGIDRKVLTPQVVDQPLAGHGLAEGQGEARHERSLGPPQVAARPADVDLHRPQQPDGHLCHPPDPNGHKPRALDRATSGRNRGERRVQPPRLSLVSTPRSDGGTR